MMKTHEIHKAFFSYLEGLFPASARIGDEKPRLFQDGYCGTCQHWSLLNSAGLHHIAITGPPSEYDEILEHMNGKKRYVYEGEEYTDTYSDYLFYGWCRRYPPTPRSGYYIGSIRSLFSRLIRYIPMRVSEYEFPLVTHECSCGEWKEAEWVADFIKRNQSSGIKPI
jgi:hypothetical protein